LRDWERRNWISPHQSSPQEIEELFRIADRDVEDCGARDLSADWKLNIAYNAALQLAKAALAAQGYRASREAQHLRIIQSLAFTLGLEEMILDRLDQFRKKRNVSDYERAGLVSETEVEEAVSLARQLRNKVEKWIRLHHSSLWPHKDKSG